MAQSELELMTSSSRTEQRKLEERERALEEAQKKLQAKEEQVSKSKEALPSLKEVRKWAFPTRTTANLIQPNDFKIWTKLIY